ncbi:MAG: HigA family addiction module antitoxin [SAR324 cluster bacterium]|nr:HigA family addiction module antitoxin [SAR324 cluster bacterium]
MRKPVSPGEFLKEVILKDHDLTIQEFALSFGITTKAAFALINNRQPMSPRDCTSAERLTYIPASFWINIQIEYCLWQANHIISQVLPSEETTEPKEGKET